MDQEATQSVVHQDFGYWICMDLEGLLSSSTWNLSNRVREQNQKVTVFDHGCILIFLKDFQNPKIDNNIVFEP